MKSIKTKFNGVEYRSKLEARWAVFFNHYGLKYEYEPESFRLINGIVYCPDFYLPELDHYCEVKPLIIKPEQGYLIYNFGGGNLVCLKKSEYDKLMLFEKPISLLCGLPLDRNFINFHGIEDWNGSLNYPCWERDHWRWWSCVNVVDYPAHRDITISADYTRYYDFFNYQQLQIRANSTACPLYTTTK
jgi:hypothetical protein